MISVSLRFSSIPVPGSGRRLTQCQSLWHRTLCEPGRAAPQQQEGVGRCQLVAVVLPALDPCACQSVDYSHTHACYEGGLCEGKGVNRVMLVEKLVGGNVRGAGHTYHAASLEEANGAADAGQGGHCECWVFRHGCWSWRSAISLMGPSCFPG